jgi:flagellar hook-length control protein FliK
MSNGVGIATALYGSVPRIAGPRPSDPEPEGSRHSQPSLESPDAGRRPLRRAQSGPPVRLSAEPSPAAPSRPSRAIPLAGSSRSEMVIARTLPPKEVVRHVAEALQSVPIREGTRIRLSLSPAHLGDLWIELSISGSGLRGRVRTETEEARDLISAHLDDLRRDLEKRGLRMGRFEVDVSLRHGKERAGRECRPRSHRRQVLDLRA